MKALLFMVPRSTEIYTLSLHDALPISKITCRRSDVMSKGKKRSGARPGRFLPLDITRSEERFSRNAETDLVCRLLLEKKNRLVMRRFVGRRVEMQDRPLAAAVEAQPVR